MRSRSYTARFVPRRIVVRGEAGCASFTFGKVVRDIERDRTSSVDLSDRDATLHSPALVLLLGGLSATINDRESGAS